MPSEAKMLPEAAADRMRMALMEVGLPHIAATAHVYPCKVCGRPRAGLAGWLDKFTEVERRMIKRAGSLVFGMDENEVHLSNKPTTRCSCEKNYVYPGQQTLALGLGGDEEVRDGNG